MPDPRTGSTAARTGRTTGRSTQQALLAALADAVQAVPGVVRLAPTLSTAGPGVLLRSSPTDGIRAVDRAGVADVDVSLCTDATHQARAVTHDVQDAVAVVLAAHDRTRGSVSVSVLAVEGVAGGS